MQNLQDPDQLGLFEIPDEIDFLDISEKPSAAPTEQDFELDDTAECDQTPEEESETGDTLPAQGNHPELFEITDVIPWAGEWQNMPSWDHRDLRPRFQVVVSFASASDVDEFAKRLELDNLEANENAKQKQIVWFPPVEKNVFKNKRYICKNGQHP